MDCCSPLNNLGHECTVHAPYNAEKLFSKVRYAPYMHRTKHHTCTIHAPYIHKWKYPQNFLINSLYGACMVHVWCMYGALFWWFCMVQIVCCDSQSLLALLFKWIAVVLVVPVIVVVIVIINIITMRDILINCCSNI